MEYKLRSSASKFHHLENFKPHTELTQVSVLSFWNYVVCGNCMRKM